VGSQRNPAFLTREGIARNRQTGLMKTPECRFFDGVGLPRRNDFYRSSVASKIWQPRKRPMLVLACASKGETIPR